MGCGGFMMFRLRVAYEANQLVGNHYENLTNAPLISGREEFFKEYNKKTNEYVESGKLKAEVANFLYQSDCDGKINKKQANEIFKLIKDVDDEIKYGHYWREDCATMKDLKLIFSDGSKVRWS